MTLKVLSKHLQSKSRWLYFLYFKKKEIINTPINHIIDHVKIRVGFTIVVINDILPLLSRVSLNPNMSD